MTDEIKSDLLSLLLHEATSYRRFEDMEKLVDRGEDLSVIPIQPLYLSLRSIPSNQISTILPKLSYEQRLAMLDLDLWHKDDLDVNSFNKWLEAYDLCEESKLKMEFAKSDPFSVFIKGRFSIYTFDLEEPEYPEHKNFFLTDDSLLVFEADDTFQHLDEVQKIIRHLYAEMGVENAYSFLFKIISDSHLIMQEREYQLKKGRLSDFGIVDYYDALQFRSTFPTQQKVDKFIDKKEGISAKIDVVGLAQALHSKSLVAFKSQMDPIMDELAKLQDEVRKNYLQFNFMRLVNGTLTLNQALKSGNLMMTKIGQETRTFLNLGFSYVQQKTKKDELKGQGLFTKFDFIDFYKIGKSLTSIVRDRLKKVLSKYSFGKDNLEYFLGEYPEQFILYAFMENSLAFDIDTKEKQEILTYDAWLKWNKGAQFIEQLVPFIEKFYLSFRELQEQHSVLDAYYLNYNIDEITFDSIILSSLSHYILQKGEIPENKLGLTLKEFKKLVGVICIVSEGKSTVNKSEVEEFIKSFVTTFGLNSIDGIDSYILYLLTENLSGYDFSTLSDDEFKHVGGPIILAV